MNYLVLESKDSMKSIYAGFNELKREGYLHLIRVGRVKKISIVYLLYHRKIALDEKQKDQIRLAVFGEVVTTSTSIYNNIINIINKNKRSYDLPKNGKSEINHIRELKDLIKFWQKNLKHHKEDSETFNRGKEALERKYIRLNSKTNRLEIKTRKKRKSFAYREILAAMEIYKNLLEAKSIIKQWPFYVGLNEFFGFNSYSQKVLFDKLTGKAAEVVLIGSWFNECRKGSDYCIEKYSSAKYHKGIVIGLATFTNTKDLYNTQLVRAADAFYNFHTKHSGQLTLPDKLDEKYATRFLEYLFQFVNSKFGNRRFKPYIVLNHDFLNVEFKEYLQDMGWLRK